MKRVFLSALVVALIAVPAGVGAKPIRTVLPSNPPFVILAGEGCAFDVGASPSGHRATTEFADGRITTVANADITLTNLAMPTSQYVQHSNYRSTETYDPEANEFLVTWSGKVYIGFFPGDEGPFGVVEGDGALLAFEGKVSLTQDANTFFFTSFSYSGTVTDLCAELAG